MIGYLYSLLSLSNILIPSNLLLTEQFADDLKSYEDGIERFSITNIMLPGSHPFFSTSIMPIITANITTITTLELQCCNLKSGDVEFISKFVKKNKLLGVLNLSRNELFDNDEEYNKAAKLLSKAMKKHPELAYVNLSNTGLGVNNEAIELILEGGKGINSLIIDSHTFDKEGLALVTDFLVKKNAVTEFSLGGGCIGKGWESRKANAKALKQCLEKNTTLEQLCLSSNLLGIGGNDRILSTVMSGIKGSISLVHVDLSGNEIGRVSSMKLIAKYLATNSSLIDLNLNNNGIKANSSNILMKALKKNNNLEHLSLARNSITDKGVPAITDVLRSNNTLLTVNVQWNKLKIENGRQELFKALCDPTSLDSIMNSNHTCRLIVAGKNYGTHEEEINKINVLENEGIKIRYKVVLAYSWMNQDIYDPRMFDDIPLELMPKLIELIQLEMGYNGYGKEITRNEHKERWMNGLSKIYETIHQWPAFPSLFARGPGKDSLTKTGKLKRKREKRVPKVADEDVDWTPKGARKQRRRSPAGSSSGSSESAPTRSSSSSGRSRRSNASTSVSYADVENSEDES